MCTVHRVNNMGSRWTHQDWLRLQKNPSEIYGRVTGDYRAKLALTITFFFNLNKVNLRDILSGLHKYFTGSFKFASKNSQFGANGSKLVNTEIFDSIWVDFDCMLRLSGGLLSLRNLRRIHTVPIYQRHTTFQVSIRTMTTPIASTSQPAQLPALQGSHTHAGKEEKLPKERKDKSGLFTAYPLEVRALSVKLWLRAKGFVAATLTRIFQSSHQNIWEVESRAWWIHYG